MSEEGEEEEEGGENAQGAGLWAQGANDPQGGAAAEELQGAGPAGARLADAWAMVGRRDDNEGGGEEQEEDNPWRGWEAVQFARVAAL